MGLILTEIEFEFGETALEFGEDFGQQVGRDGGDDAHSDASVQGASGLMGEGLDILEFPQDVLGASQDLSSVVGEQDLSRPPFEQAHAEMFFELMNLDTQGGLGDTATAGGLSEMECFGEGFEILELS